MNNLNSDCVVATVFTEVVALVTIHYNSTFSHTGLELYFNSRYTIFYFLTD